MNKFEKRETKYAKAVAFAATFKWPREWQEQFDAIDSLFEPCLGSGRDNCRCRTCEPSDVESEIIFRSNLTFEEKRAKLQVLRGEKVKPKSFNKRLTKGDRIIARGLGIRLDLR